MNRHFSSCNSTANSSTRLCAVASVRSASLFAEAKRPWFVSLMLLARDEHADEQTHAERDPNALIGMIADHFVCGPGSCDRLLLQTLAGVFGAFHRRRESSADCMSLLAHLTSA